MEKKTTTVKQKEITPKKVKTTARLKEISEIPNKQKIEMENSYSFISKITRQLTEEEIVMLTKIQEENKIDNVSIFLKTYNEIYSRRIEPCNCGGLYNDLAQQLFIQMKYQLL